MKQVYIYVLKDSVGNIRYVGKTINIKKRLHAHIVESRSPKKRRHVLHWIHSLLLKNEKPVIEIIEICNESNWEEKEIFWINYYKKIVSNLCNTAEGGKGGSGRKNYTLKEKLKLAKLASERFSRFNILDKQIIWKMIQNEKSILEIQQYYPTYTRHIHFSIINGRNWNFITLLPKTKGVTKRKGYTIRGKKYVVRNKNRETIFSSFIEQEVINWLKNYPA